LFDIGWSELLLISVLALVVVGPRDLPAMLRTLGRYAGKLKRTANEFRDQFSDAMRQSEFDQVRRELDSIREENNPVEDINRSLERLDTSLDELENASDTDNLDGNLPEYPPQDKTPGSGKDAQDKIDDDKNSDKAAT
jgi:sec-independent protein translocase protein TatB